MKTYKKIHDLIAAYLALIAALLRSCQKPPTNEYTGPNNIGVTSSDKTLSPQAQGQQPSPPEGISVNKETQAVNITVDNDPLRQLLLSLNESNSSTPARSVSFEGKTQ